MQKIPSFTIDHIRLLRGIYVSRKDEVGGETVTTFDIRMKEPNREPVLGQPEIHTIEQRRLDFTRCASAGNRDFPLYSRIRGRNTGCNAERLRQLPDDESSYGEMGSSQIPPRSIGTDYRCQLGISPITNRAQKKRGCPVLSKQPLFFRLQQVKLNYLRRPSSLTIARYLSMSRDFR